MTPWELTDAQAFMLGYGILYVVLAVYLVVEVGLRIDHWLWTRRSRRRRLINVVIYGPQKSTEFELVVTEDQLAFLTLLREESRDASGVDGPEIEWSEVDTDQLRRNGP